MTPEQRIDQLEFLLSEAMSTLDSHAAQLKQNATLLTRLIDNSDRLINIVEQQGQSISFLLTELAGAGSRQQELAERSISMESQLNSIHDKLDLILLKLS